MFILTNIAYLKLSKLIKKVFICKPFSPVNQMAIKFTRLKDCNGPCIVLLFLGIIGKAFMNNMDISFSVNCTQF